LHAAYGDSHACIGIELLKVKVPLKCLGNGVSLHRVRGCCCLFVPTFYRRASHVLDGCCRTMTSDADAALFVIRRSFSLSRQRCRTVESHVNSPAAAAPTADTGCLSARNCPLRMLMYCIGFNIMVQYLSSYLIGKSGRYVAALPKPTLEYYWWSAKDADQTSDQQTPQSTKEKPSSQLFSM
jgi:hypothetical protein